MTTDLLIHWPETIDYPYFRQQLKECRHHFDRVIVQWTHGHGPDWVKQIIHEFIPQYMPYAQFLPLYELESGADWANVSVNNMLKESEADQILIMHQDFIMALPERFMRNNIHNGFELYGYASPAGMIQPVFFKATRKFLETTSKDFSADQGVCDHFERISQEYNATHEDLPISFQACGVTGYEHISGVTQNWGHGLDPAYSIVDPVGFVEYINLCLNAQHVQKIDYITERLMKLKERIVKENASQ